MAVKEITISVTKTDGGEYASVESIQFLKDALLAFQETARLLSRALTLTMSGASGALLGCGSAETMAEVVPSQAPFIGVTVKQ